MIYLLWVLYSMTEGAREAIYYHTRNFNVPQAELHTFYTIQRSIVLLICVMLNNSMLFIAPLAFPFFHDGMYYTMRNRLNPYIYKETWFAQSTTSTAVLTKIFTPVVRTICVFISLLLWIIINANRM